MKIKRNILYFLTVFMFVFSVYKIIDTYAIFYTEKSSELSLPIGKWNISLNGLDIVGGITEEIILDNFSVNENEYTEKNKIAPGMEGFFEIEVFPQDTQVSIRYDIEIENEILEGNQVKLLEVIEINNNSELIRTGEKTYTGIILLDDIDKEYSELLKITFSWENIEDNNEEDTQIGINNNPEVKIPLKFTAKQYLGETIEEYIERE